MLRVLLLLVFLLPLATPVPAEVEWQLNQNFKLPTAPVDMTTSADGQRIFALLPGGEVRIYDAAGRQQEVLKLGRSADRIRVSPDGGRLILTKGQEVSLVSLDYIKPIDISGSPVKGPEDAGVVVAVYSDFQ